MLHCNILKLSTHHCTANLSNVTSLYIWDHFFILFRCKSLIFTDENCMMGSLFINEISNCLFFRANYLISYKYLKMIIVPILNHDA